MIRRRGTALIEVDAGEARPGKSRRAGRLLPCASLLGALALSGCNDPRDCALGIAHRDCYPEGSLLATFPQEDAICRSYDLQPGTRDYKICREQKRHERLLSERASDFGVLEEPLTPDIRPVYQVP